MPRYLTTMPMALLGLCSAGALVALSAGIGIPLVWSLMASADGLGDGIVAAYYATIVTAALTLAVHAWLTVVVLRWRGLRQPGLVAALGNGVFYASAVLGVLTGTALLLIPLVLVASYPLASRVTEQDEPGGRTAGVVLLVALVASAVPVGLALSALERARQDRADARSAAEAARIVPIFRANIVAYMPQRMIRHLTIKQAYVIEGETTATDFRDMRIVFVYGRPGRDRGHVSVVQVDDAATRGSNCDLAGQPVRGGCAVVGESADGTKLYAERLRLERSRGRPREVFLKRSKTAIAVRAPGRGATVAEYVAIVDALREQPGRDVKRLLRRATRGRTALERQGLATYLPTALPPGARFDGARAWEETFDRAIELRYDIQTSLDAVSRHVIVELRPDQGDFRPPRRCVLQQVLQQERRFSGCRLVATTHNRRRVYKSSDDEGRTFYVTRIANTLVTVGIEDLREPGLTERETVALVASLRRRTSDKLARRGVIARYPPDDPF